MKKGLVVLLVLVMSFAMFTGVVAAESKNLIINGDFKNTADKSWKFESWSNLGKFEYGADNKGTSIVTISTTKDTDARLYQNIVLEKNSVYKFSADLLASDFVSKTNAGANLSVIGQTVQSPSFYDTKGAWVSTVLYINVGDKVTGPLKVSIGVGGYSSMNSGKVSYKNVKLVKLSEPAPKGAAMVQADELFVKQSAPSASTPNQTSDGSLVLYVVIGLIIIGLGVGYYFFVIRKKEQDISEDSEDADGNVEENDDENKDDENK